MFEILEYTFFRHALVGMFFLSIAAGVIGTYIVTRRLVSLAGGITHACFGGLGLGYFLGLNPIVTAGVFAVASSMGVEWLATRRNVREDSAIAVIWAFGMAVGVLLVFLTPGYVPELNAFLFGNLLTITSTDLWAFGVYTALLAAFFLMRADLIMACAFDRDFARVSRLPVRAVNYTMTVFIAVGIVLTIRLVGIMLLLSMLTLPQMIAEHFASRFKPMVLWAVAVSVLTSIAGLLMASVIDVPCSSVIVLLQVACYAVVSLFRAFRN